jgi:hypothetical protein
LIGSQFSFSNGQRYFLFCSTIYFVNMATNYIATEPLTYTIFRAIYGGQSYTLIYLPDNSRSSSQMLSNFLHAMVVDHRVAQRLRVNDLVVRGKRIEAYPPYYYFYNGDPDGVLTFKYILLNGDFGKTFMQFILENQNHHPLIVQYFYNSAPLYLEHHLP